jgi:hypothetical protein
MKQLIQFMQRYTLSCEKATLLMEMANAQQLAPWQKLQLAFHKGMCNMCTDYHKDSIRIDDELSSLARSKKPSQSPRHEWTDKDKEALIQQINDNACDHGPIKNHPTDI